MKRRWKILIALGIFLALVAASLTVTMHLEPQSEVEAYKKLLRDQGEKLEISEVLPPHIPDASNGVALMQSAFGVFACPAEEFSNLPPAMQMVAPGKALVGWNQPDVRRLGTMEFTNSWENIQAAMQAEYPVVELLQETAAFPALDFHLDYQSSYEIPAPHLGPLKHAAQILAATAMCNLHSGDPAAAATNLCALLSLVQQEAGERTVEAQYVRAALVSMALGVDWELLQSTNLADNQLAPLQARWQQQEFFTGTEGVLLMQRAWVEKLLRAMRASYSDFEALIGGGGGISAWSFTSSGDWIQDAHELARSGMESSHEHAILALWQNSWSFSDEERFLKKYQVVLEALRSAHTNPVLKSVFGQMDSRLNSMKITNSWDALDRILGAQEGKWVFSEGYVDAGFAKKLVNVEVSRQMVIVAIALKRFQLKHGVFPEKISELAPEFLPATPLDPLDGNPLRYHRNPEGTFTLYSIGEDCVDDGGDTLRPGVASASPSNWSWQRARDWVWPQPASPEEVKMFYEEQDAIASARAAAMPPEAYAAPVPSSIN